MKRKCVCNNEEREREGGGEGGREGEGGRRKIEERERGESRYLCFQLIFSVH